MVYCRAGMSRSATLCIAYFMRYHNMTMDEAFQFVKEKRPIIHPNPGFLRQLKQFEAKLHNRRSGLKRKFEENDYSYAQFEECIAFEDTNFEDLVVIKPRPKPRIMKPKLVTPENSDMPLEIAQSYCMTDITVCLADDQIPSIAQFVPSKSKSVRTKRPGGSHHGTKPSVRPKSMVQPVRPRTPAGHLGQDNIISNWGYHDPMAVAESIEPVPMETITPRGKDPSGSFKKRPFSKISEPQKVAVSYQTFPWAFCEPFTKKANFHSEIPNYSIIADLHLPLAQKFQEITFECTGQEMVAEPTLSFSSSSTLSTEPLSSSQTQNLPPTTPALERVRTLVTSIRLGPVAILETVILECPGVYQKVNADNAAAALENSSKPNTTASASASNLLSKEHVPSRFSGLSTSRTSGLSRTSATRASIKLSPGVKISPAIPAGHTKRPVPNLDLDFRWVASIYQPPIVFERVTETDGVKKFKPDKIVANTILWHPMVGVACHRPVAVIFDSAVKDDSLSFKWASLLTVPKRSVICRPPDLLTVGETYAYVMEDSKEISVMPHREYPYYFRVGPSAETGNNICDKATELPKVKVSIGARPVTPPPVFKPVIFVKPDAFVKPVVVPEPVTNPTAVVRERSGLPKALITAQPVIPAPVAKPVEPAKPVAVKPVLPEPVVKEKRKLIYEPQINWAATRCEFDPCTIGRESRPMEDRPAFEKAKISYEKSIKDSKYRSAPCQISDYTHHLEEPENLSNAYRIPEKYNSFMITRFNCFPLYQVLDGISIQEPCLMVNMYCEPTPFKAWARTTTHTLLCDSIGKFTYTPATD